MHFANSFKSNDLEVERGACPGLHRSALLHRSAQRLIRNTPAAISTRIKPNLNISFPHWVPAPRSAPEPVSFRHTPLLLTSFLFLHFILHFFFSPFVVYIFPFLFLSVLSLLLILFLAFNCLFSFRFSSSPSHFFLSFSPFFHQLFSPFLSCREIRPETDRHGSIPQIRHHGETEVSFFRPRLPR